MHISNAHPGSRQRPGAPLIVHSHLRWDFVWQRPQQLLTRFAEHGPVLFLEEPIFLDDVSKCSLSVTIPYPNIYRAVPSLPGWLRGEYDLAIAEVRTLAMNELSRDGTLGMRFADPVQWFYTPMPAPAMLGAFHEVAVVYDCMDELSKFRFAHPDLGRRERLLLSSADVVFTGGRKLWKSKSRMHSNVHFFGCGVDAEHFGKARDRELEIPADLAAVTRADAPLAGYYGVIDERLDYELIATLAASDAGLDVVMIGPTAKVDPASLPKAPNLHWLGTRPYEQLPDYVRAFDVCIMPFALNEATEYINPTKTLEYMAAGRPVVSTAVPDVVSNFVPVVRVARDAQDFVTGVKYDARHADGSRIRDGIAMAEAASWDAIVGAMTTLIRRSIDAAGRRKSALAEASLDAPITHRGERRVDAVSGDAGLAATSILA
ncbi:MAG: glycosyltransferase [Gemmatimonadota bacterium]|nr:glycosyltransferase [Gemmatimonadota bacterium]